MKLLNLGCGNHYHKEWINIDYVENNEDIITHNLHEGIPLPENEVDVVYSSHLLEHFSKSDSNYFISECYRVLKPEGIMRIVVPDLRIICQIYVELVDELLHGNLEREDDYDWIMLEMFDQAVRSYGGGEMGKYMARADLKNKDFIISRIGSQAKNYWDNLEKSKKTLKRLTAKFNTKNLPSRIKARLQKIILGKEKYGYLNEGTFRNSGQIHKWMYDEFSLIRLLKNNGFAQVKVLSAFAFNKIPIPNPIWP